MSTLLLIIGSLASLAILSFAGLIFLLLNRKQLTTAVPYVLIFAAGVFLGELFFYLLPRIFRDDPSDIRPAICILLGIGVFYTLDTLIFLYRCNVKKKCSTNQIYLAPNIISDAMDNFLDGIVITSTYIASVEIGIATTIATAFHEVPKEISDTALFLETGLTPRKAIQFNLLTTLATIVGALTSYFFVETTAQFEWYMFPFAAGTFTYIAGSNLIPRIQKDTRVWATIGKLFCFAAGAGSMLLLKLNGQ